MIYRAVYDTNIIVSALLKPKSLPASLVALGNARAVQVYLSPLVLAEYDEVLRRPRFGFLPAFVDRFIGEITAAAVMVDPAERLTAATDEPDNRFLECALAARADYLVTGNLRHFPAPEFEGIRIVSPVTFAEVVAEHGI